MAIHPSLLTTTKPVAVAPANVHISHIQLRDLILCPRESGVVTYVHESGIVEHDIHAPPGTAPRVIAHPDFPPNTLAALPIPDTNDILYAAGGQDADLHFSYHTTYSSSSSSAPSPPSSSSIPSSSSRTNITSSSNPSSPRRKRFRPSSTTKLVWQFSKHLENCSINNSVLLTTSLGLSRSNESAVEPRAIVSNNDYTVKFFDVPLRTQGSKHSRNLKEVGLLKLSVPINYTSLAPDARTLLSVGDSSTVYLHHVSGGDRLTFTPITSLTLPEPKGFPPSFWYPPHSLAASFSTAFSADGVKFAIASQEGVVAVWDVRSTKPMKVFQTDKSTGLGLGSLGAGGLWAGGAAAALAGSAASGWLFEDHWHGHGGVRAPGWSVRSVKFGGGVGGSGKEVMAFTEHSNRLHIVDARTFETEQIVRMPAARGSALAPTPLSRPTPTARSASTRPLSASHISSLRARSSASPPVDLVYSQLPGFARRGGGGNIRYLAPFPRSPQNTSIVQALGDTFRVSTGNDLARRDEQRDRELRDIQERREQRARELVARRFGRSGASRNAGTGEEGGASAPSTVGRYSPPSSIGDSTWRTLRTAGEEGGTFGRGGGDSRVGLARFVHGPTVSGGEVDDRDGEEAALLLIPALVDGVEARDVEELLDRHGVVGIDRVRGRERARDDDEERDGDREEDREDDEDRNTGSAVADFDYPYEFGDSRVWRDADGAERERVESEMDIDEAGPSSRGGYNWITRRHEEDEDEEREARERERGGEREREKEEEERTGSESELDLAGVCFDPSGGRVYVASTKGVAEWNVRGADKRWWTGDGWV
ncbi:hypothetical protein AX17_006601 [Amanita inopinata Kibby_2008]|nr:hypothetical protein AX17_006601 [Amanita inopinata Kibby_2008]